MPVDDTTQTGAGLEALGEALRATGLPLDLGPASMAREVRDKLAHQIDDYLLPRLRRLDAPLLAVIGGSTGSGKSTITNTLLGRLVSPAGVLRPTTRSPVVVCHPDDGPWFAGGDILPGLPRLTADDPTPGNVATDDATAGAVLRMVADEGVGPGLAILDAPDIDSVESANRDLAAQLLASADLWLFTTTAMRYADAVPWAFLHEARERGTALAVIINRIPPGASGEVVPHLETMLAERGLSDVAVHPVEQTELIDGRLPEAAVAGIRSLLDSLADDAEARAAIIRSTLDGALASIDGRVVEVLDAARAEQHAVDELSGTIDQTYQRAIEQLADDIGSGKLLRGEVLDRWQELVGTAEFMQAIQSRISMIRDRFGAFLSGRPAATAQVQGEITSTLEQLLLDHADAAAEATVDRWHNLPGGPQVLAGGEPTGADGPPDRSLERASDRFREAAGSEVRAWQDDLLELVRQRGAGKRATARVLAFGINSVGVALMLVLFSQTAGLSGGEIAIGAGTAGLSQTLLSALFGEQAVRELAVEARGLLVTRIGRIFDDEAARFEARLAEVAGDPAAAVDGLEAARRTLRGPTT